MVKGPRLVIAALTVLALSAVTAAPLAQAKDGDVIRRGSCSGASTWKLKLSPEDGKIEVEFEVDQNVVGDVWRVKIFHDGELVFRGKRTTKAPSGSFEVRIVEPNRAGPDDFVAKARNLSTDEVCRGSATF
ncbi:MAG: hypothetical protein KatS3mg013_1321 [Actinomycetota bacterium]|jgi:hypothetical protein|nr:MAG: hypothetical protein KatS3mg013_1321 [Actinomycetota bacterium]